MAMFRGPALMARRLIWGKLGGSWRAGGAIQLRPAGLAAWWRRGEGLAGATALGAR